MTKRKIWAVYFSPTAGTKYHVLQMAETFLSLISPHLDSESIDSKVYKYDFTLPKSRNTLPSFQEDDIVFFGTPVYAGRQPSLFVDFLNSFLGNSAIAIPISSFGGRDYGDALRELIDILTEKKFRCIAAASLVSAHPFSQKISPNRPNNLDKEGIIDFLKILGSMIITANLHYSEVDKGNICSFSEISGSSFPYSGYYKPRNEKGGEMDIRKIKPLTKDNCIRCGACSEICPLGAISHTTFENEGKCMKCFACVKKCKSGSKFFSDPDLLFHILDLERSCCIIDAKNSFFINNLNLQ